MAMTETNRIEFKRELTRELSALKQLNLIRRISSDKTGFGIAV